MAKEDDVLIQLATRIPKGLHREIKLYCVQTGISVMEFVASALEEKLRKASGRDRTPRVRALSASNQDSPPSGVAGRTRARI